MDGALAIFIKLNTCTCIQVPMYNVTAFVFAKIKQELLMKPINR